MGRSFRLLEESLRLWWVWVRPRRVGGSLLLIHAGRKWGGLSALIASVGRFPGASRQAGMGRAFGAGVLFAGLLGESPLRL
jgi:hypothetical protein